MCVRAQPLLQKPRLSQPSENQFRSTNAEMRKCESSAKRTRINCGRRRLLRGVSLSKVCREGRIQPTRDVEVTARKGSAPFDGESRNKESERRSNSNSVTFSAFDCLDAALATNSIEIRRNAGAEGISSSARRWGPKRRRLDSPTKGKHSRVQDTHRCNRRGECGKEEVAFAIQSFPFDSSQALPEPTGGVGYFC